MRMALLLVSLSLAACKDSSETAPSTGSAAPSSPQAAKVVREEASDVGETRLFSAGVADLDGDGSLELVAGGFSAEKAGRHPTIRIYRQNGDTWTPLAEAGWDTAADSMVRNVEIADADGDGKLDVIAVGRVGNTPKDASARVTVFGLDGGKLVPHAEATWKNGMYSHGYGLAAGELDRDGTVEIVTSGFEFDGTLETGFIRVWKVENRALVLRSAVTLDGQGSPGMRVNDIAIGDVDGDGVPEIVAAGRHGPLKTADSKVLAKRREAGDLSVLSFVDGKLQIRARYSWAKGTSARFRTVALVDLDANRSLDIVVGGQYDADGKAALATFTFANQKLALKQDASSTAEGVSGEVKDLVTVASGPTTHVLATGALGGRPARLGIVAAWRIDRGNLVQDASASSRHGDDTLARSVVVVPTKTGSKILTIGFATQSAAMVGQLLEWTVGANAP
ncbi:MAG TPA: VCBS repeat-containing protein [Kofleriaceae bacterium]